MGKILVEYNRQGCIGADICTLFSPDHFKMSDERKADLIGGQEKGEIFVKEVSETDLEKLKQSADGCPAKVIIIKKDGVKLAPTD